MRRDIISRPALDLLLGAAGVSDGTHVVLYGDNNNWFVLRHLLGYANVKNYDGSWTEYGSLIGVPVEK